MAANLTLAKQWFLDPISGNSLADPVLNHCGHFYNRASFEQWTAKEGQHVCPLCRAPIQMLIQSVLLQQAVNIVSIPEQIHFTSVDQLTDEDREIVDRAIQSIRQQNERDTSANIPTRLTPYFGDVGVLSRAAAYSRDVSKKVCC